MAGSETSAANHRPGDSFGGQNRCQPSPNIIECARHCKLVFIRNVHFPMNAFSNQQSAFSKTSKKQLVRLSAKADS